MKKLIIILLLLCSILLVGCASKREKLEGYWMAENGDTIMFLENGEIMIDDTTCKYSLNEDGMMLTHWGETRELKYKIKRDELYLTDSDNNTTCYYKNADKQKKIKEQIALSDKIVECSENIKGTYNTIQYNIEAIKEYEEDNEDRKKTCQEYIDDGFSDVEYYENLRDDFIKANNERIDSLKKENIMLKKDLKKYKKELAELEKQRK